MTNNVTEFPTAPAKRQYTLTYIENPIAKEPEIVSVTALGYLIELGPFTGVSEAYGEKIASEVSTLVPTMNVVRIDSEAATVN